MKQSEVALALSCSILVSSEHNLVTVVNKFPHSQVPNCPFMSGGLETCAYI
jgi:hypothetical protein